jgi:AraC-like DNA-binding protein
MEFTMGMNVAQNETLKMDSTEPVPALLDRLLFAVMPVPEIRSIGMTAESAAWRLPMRVIPEFEWIVCVQGKILFHVDGCVQALSPGQALLLFPEVPHRAWCEGEGVCRFYYVHFMPCGPFQLISREEDERRLASLRASLDAEVREKPFYILPRIRMDEISLPVQADLGSLFDPVCSLFERALAERSHYAIDSQLLIGHHVTQMLVYAARTISMDNKGLMISEEGAMDPLLQDAVARIHERLGMPLQVHLLAQELGISPQYLSRLFNRRFGMSPLHYVNRLRLNRAKELMRTTRMHVQEISWACGYANPHYFSRLFRKYEGESPTQYVKRLDFRRN